MPNHSPTKRRLVWHRAGGKGKQQIRDADGVEIRWNAYADRSSQYGWNVDHIKPKSQGGTNDISNLRPLSIRGNSRRGQAQNR